MASQPGPSGRINRKLDRLERSGEPQAGAFATEFARYLPPLVANTGLAGTFRVRSGS